MSLLSASSKSTLPGGAVSDKCLYMNPQLMLNAASYGCQPSNGFVPETVPQDFVEMTDISEIQSQHVGKTDDCCMSCELVACSVTSVECDSHVVEQLTSRTNHMQPNVIMRSPGHSSPISNHQCQSAIHVPVSSSPSLFDDDEEKRSHQKNISKNLLLTSEKNVGTTSQICTNVHVSKSSPSVLSRKMGVNVSAHQEKEKNKYQLNVDHRQQTLPLPLQSAVNERESLQTVNEVKCKDICDCNEILPNELAMQLNATDDRHMQMLGVHSVPTKVIPVASAIDTLAVSSTGTISEQNPLAAAVKLPQQDISSAVCSLSDIEPVFQQPLPKKRRHEGVNSSLPHAGSTDNPTQGNSKLFRAFSRNIIF